MQTIEPTSVTFDDRLGVIRQQAQVRANMNGAAQVIYEAPDPRGRYRVFAASAPSMPEPARFIESIMPDVDEAGH